MSIKYKIRDVAYELHSEQGTATVYTTDGSQEFGNALEGWNYFTSLALWPMAESIRDELERNGYNRHTGIKEENHE